MPILIPGLHCCMLVLGKDTGRFRGDETTSSSQRIHRKTNITDTERKVNNGANEVKC